ncbi:MAG: hypothetical protein ACI957_005734 [Verrucomicrobiales bacterium]|jgi:hypothetical protein
MNTGAYRHAEVIAAHLAEDTKGLERVAHDILRLGVRLGLLMEKLHAGHLAPLLGILDAVEKQDWLDPGLGGHAVVDEHGVAGEQVSRLSWCRAAAEASSPSNAGRGTSSS